MVNFSQKLKKELEEKQQKLSDVTTQLTAIESKCGWFERRLTETEVKITANKT